MALLKCNKGKKWPWSWPWWKYWHHRIWQTLEIKILLSVTLSVSPTPTEELLIKPHHWFQSSDACRNPVSYHYKHMCTHPWDPWGNDIGMKLQKDLDPMFWDGIQLVKSHTIHETCQPAEWSLPEMKERRMGGREQERKIHFFPKSVCLFLTYIPQNLKVL